MKPYYSWNSFFFKDDDNFFMLKICFLSVIKPSWEERGRIFCVWWLTVYTHSDFTTSLYQLIQLHFKVWNYFQVLIATGKWCVILKRKSGISINFCAKTNWEPEQEVHVGILYFSRLMFTGPVCEILRSGTAMMKILMLL